MPPRRRPDAPARARRLRVRVPPPRARRRSWPRWPAWSTSRSCAPAHYRRWRHPRAHPDVADPGPAGRHLRPQRRGAGHLGADQDGGGRRLPDPHPLTEATVLSPLLGCRWPRWRAELREHSGYVPLAAERLRASAATKVAADDLPGITLLDTSERVDPDGDLAVAGARQVHAAGTGAARASSTSTTRCWPGRPGPRRCSSRRPGSPCPGTPRHTGRPRPGTGLELTLDEPLQYVTEQALGPPRSPPATRGERHGDGHGRPDRRHPGHGQPGGDPAERHADASATATANAPASARSR